MTFTVTALDTIKDYLISVLDPDVYDAEALADELVDLADEAESLSWTIAAKDIRGLLEQDKLTADALNRILARNGLSL